MASEYLLKKAREQAEQAPPPPLTKQQKWNNWWDYHKWLVLGGILLLIFLGWILADALGLGEVRPDYQVAYVGPTELTLETAQALQSALEAVGTDRNGDGVVCVQLNQYTIRSLVEEDTDPYGFVGEIQLSGDIQGRQSCIFLLATPEAFQLRYHVLRRLDGTIPEEEDSSTEGIFIPWDSCPSVPSTQELGLTDTLALARRGYLDGKTCDDPQGCDALWEALVQGAAAG